MVQQLAHARARREPDVPVPQPIVDAARGLEPRGHRVDQRGRPRRAVATREHAGARRGKRGGIGGDAVPAVECDAVGFGQRALAHLLPDRGDERVTLEHARAVGHGLDAAAALRVRFGDAHVRELDARHAPVLGQDARGVREEVERDAFLLGRLDLGVVGRHVHFPWCGDRPRARARRPCAARSARSPSPRCRRRRPRLRRTARACAARRRDRAPAAGTRCRARSP